MMLLLTTVHQDARSALDCGSEAAALNPKRKGGSWRYRTPRCLRHMHFRSSEESCSALRWIGALDDLPGNAGLRFSGPWFYPSRAADLTCGGLRYSRYHDEEPRASSTRISTL